jgi:hypothetical protein
MLPRLAVLLACLPAFGCLDAAQMRRFTYPPDFHFITREEITDTMTGLAYWIDELEEIMWRDDELTASDRERVVEILTEMRRLAFDLKSGTRSNHPRIDRAAPWLQTDIERALGAARRDPPNYFYAGEVAGACEYCHVPRHRTVRPRDAELPPRSLD